MTCHTPAAGSWRAKMRSGDDKYVLDRLHMAYEHAGPEKNSRIRADWSHFRAVTLREVRKRGLEVPEETLALIRQRGITL